MYENETRQRVNIAYSESGSTSLVKVKDTFKRAVRMKDSRVLLLQLQLLLCCCKVPSVRYCTVGGLVRQDMLEPQAPNLVYSSPLIKVNSYYLTIPQILFGRTFCNTYSGIF